MAYVDGFVIPIKKNNLREYKKMAKEAGEIWMKHGALQFFECVGDDLNPEMDGMEFTKFPKLAKAKSDEIVIFSFIVYKSKSHRDKVNKKVMKEMDEKHEDEEMPMPFDVKKMAYGGFETIVNMKNSE